MSIRVIRKGACIAAVAMAVAGCSSAPSMFDSSEGHWFSKPLDLFKTPDWAKADVSAKGVNLGPKGPVGPEELVHADGTCAPAAAPPTAQAQAQEKPEAAKPPAAAAPGPELEPEGGAGMGTGMAPPTVAGGVGLGMTECQVVRRAGTPNKVTISNDGGTRNVVLTYLGGSWPGVYTFKTGRLDVIDRAPEPEKPARSAPKRKRSPKSAQNTTHGPQDVYVQ